MEWEIVNGVYKPKAIKFEEDDGLAQEPGWCARYARLLSLDLLIDDTYDEGFRVWNPNDTWNFAFENRVAWHNRKKEPFDARELKRTIIRYIYSL